MPNIIRTTYARVVAWLTFALSYLLGLFRVTSKKPAKYPMTGVRLAKMGKHRRQTVGDPGPGIGNQYGIPARAFRNPTTRDLAFAYRAHLAR